MDILVKAIAIAMAGMVVTSGATAVIENAPETHLEPISEVLEQKTVVDEPEPETAPETAPEQDAPKTPQRVEQTEQRSSAVEPHYSDGQDHYTTIMQVEADYMGWCPKDVPDWVWPDKISPLIALGYKSTFTLDELKDPINYTRLMWSTYMTDRGYGDGYKFIAVERVGVLFDTLADGWVTNGGYTASKSGYYFSMNWSNRTIYTDDEWAYIPLEQTEHGVLDRVAGQMTAELRRLDAEYARKCGV